MAKTRVSKHPLFQPGADGVARAGHEVVVDQAGGLHERVADRAAGEGEAALLPVAAHGIGHGREGGRILAGDLPPATVSATLT